VRIALCLSGQPRGLLKASEYVKRNLLSREDVDYDVDVFCHTWDDGSLVEKVYLPTHLGVTQSSFMKIGGDYNTRDPVNHPARNTFCFYYSLYCADMFRRHEEQNGGFTYDVVIRSRYDYAIARPLVFSEFNLDYLWTPQVKITMPSGFLCTDQFAFSNSSNMSIYSEVYPNMMNYHDTGTIVNGEDMLARHLRESQISDRVSYIDMWDPFIGGRYNYGPHSLVRDDMQDWTTK